MKRILLATAVALALCGPALAADDSPTIEWKKVGAWEIRVDRSVGDGCYVTTAYEDGTVFRVGILPDEERGYLDVSNDAWRSLIEGEFYDIEVRFDGRAPWPVEAMGVADNGLFSPVEIEPFIADFALGRVVTITYAGKHVARLDLAGSHAATDEMLKCQEAMGAAGPDPFRVAPTAADPFA